jgi:uncharacterized protein
MASAPVAPVPSVPGVHRRGVAALSRAHPLGAFLAVTFAFSWLCEIVAFGVLDLAFEVAVIPAAFGPAIGAYVVLRAVEGRAGVHAWLRRLTLWRVDPKLYVFAVVVLPALVIASYAFLPDGSDKLGDAGAAFPVSFLGMLIVLALLGGGQEEPGWRGFALPRLLERYTPLGASVRLGVIWALWHLPLFVFVADYDNAGTDVAGVAAMFVIFTVGLTIGLSIIQTWLYHRSGGSVFLAVVAHGAANASFAFLPSTWLPTAVGFTVVGLVAAAVTLFTHRELGRGADKADRSPAR